MLLPSVNMLNVPIKFIMLNVVMLNVVAPLIRTQFLYFTLQYKFALKIYFFNGSFALNRLALRLMYCLVACVNTP
jgi:hypothetical protein